jgi:hypothetical protein
METQDAYFRTAKYIAKEKLLAQFMTALFEDEYEKRPSSWHITRHLVNDSWEVCYNTWDFCRATSNIYRMGSADVIVDAERNYPSKIISFDCGSQNLSLAIPPRPRSTRRYDHLILCLDKGVGTSVRVSESMSFDYEGKHTKHDPIPFTMKLLKEHGAEFILNAQDDREWHRNDDASLAEHVLHAFHDNESIWTTDLPEARKDPDTRIIYPSGWARRRWALTARF